MTRAPALKVLCIGGSAGFDRAKVEADARFDGLFVLRTNTKIAALQVAIITVIVGRCNQACSDQVRRPEMGGPAPARSEAPRASSAAAAA